MVKVFKFGGASVKDAAAIRHISTILSDYKGENILIVISAMGKMTNALEEIVTAYFNNDDKAFGLLKKIKQEHEEIIRDLFGENAQPVLDLVNDQLVEIEWVLEDPVQDSYDYIYDQIVSVGELVSTTIISAYWNHIGLKTHWLDARDLIVTDDTYREGKINWLLTNERINNQAAPLFDKTSFILTQGFIGGTTDNYTTTLGREGSDFSAAVFAYCLNAGKLHIWKDVEGILTADPRLFDNAFKIDRLSYKEAIEMTYYGAKVIHPKTIKPLQNKSIPLYVSSFVEPKKKGTLISDDGQASYPPVVVVEKNQVLLRISTRDFSFVAEHHLSQLFQLFAKNRIKINMMRNTAISFMVCITNKNKRIENVINALKEDFKVLKDESLELITIRHYQEEVVQELKQGRIILLEERIPQTVQIVVQNVPTLKRKEY